MKRLAIAAIAVALSLEASAFEKYMMRIPDELGPKDGFQGVTQEFARAAVSIPLGDGNWIYIVNDSPTPPGEGGILHMGEPKKVVDLDVISRYREAMKGFPSVAVQLGETTFFAYRTGRIFPPCEGLYLDNCYQGVVVSMGAEYSLSVFLPEGGGLDAEVRGILKKVSLAPLPGIGVDTALKLYGKGSAVPAAARLAAVRKLVGERGECCELIELLSTLTDDEVTKAWCQERLAFLNPGKYAGDDGDGVAEYDMGDKAQQQAIMEMLSASDKAEKASVMVPSGDGGNAGEPAAVAAETKTVTLPGGAAMEFIWCGKGTFTMGQNDGEWDPSKEEEPRRKITLSKGLWLAKYETTQGQWKSVMGGNPSAFTGDDDLPVEQVSWNMCKEFIRKAGAAGVKLRLPTEAEWEYACRAGTRTAYYWGYQADTKQANFDGVDPYHPERSQPTVGKPVKVGSYEPNPWGFFDMAGNVAEWCEDDWQDEPPPENQKDPLYMVADVPEDGGVKVHRGGHWNSRGFSCRAAGRDWYGPDRQTATVGVRFVLEE